MSEESTSKDREPLPAPGPDARRIRMFILGGVSILMLAVFGLYVRAAARTNHVTLAQTAKPVSVQKSAQATYRPVRTYVGTTNAWNVARVGPQYVSAYVGTVLVRPGAIVKRGEVLATLDCRNASAASREIAAKAKALEEHRVALAHESERVKQMTESGFASQNEAEQLSARSSAQAAEIESLKASMVSRSLEVDDCVLRAPFAGEVVDRFVDPGTYLKPGSPVVTVIDRSTVRIAADSPEADFAVVAPGTPVAIEVEATGAKSTANISRRAPAADESTRTVHFEIDVPNADRLLPAGTTAKLTIQVGQPRPATSVPLRSATMRGDKATLFVVDGQIAKRTVATVLGELGDLLYLDARFPANADVVVEGRALLDDGDRVAAKEITR